MPTYRLDLAYDGSGFHGYARQPDQRTVQGELEGALERVTGSRIDTEAAGRTDAGVHARHQVVSFNHDEPLQPVRIGRSLGKLLSPEIAVTRCIEVDDTFSARFSATSRRYRYRILNRPHPDPLRRITTWHVADPLDLDAMAAAAAALVGEHDFASFCRAAQGRSTVRRVLSATWNSKHDDLLVFDIHGTAFCHQMVRSLVAYSVEVGRGRIEPEMTAEVLAARDRNAARGAAPPQGLMLWEVGYG